MTKTFQDKTLFRFSNFGHPSSAVACYGGWTRLGCQTMGLKVKNAEQHQKTEKSDKHFFLEGRASARPNDNQYAATTKRGPP